MVHLSEKINRNILGPNFFNPKFTRTKLFQTDRTRRLAHLPSFCEFVQLQLFGSKQVDLWKYLRLLSGPHQNTVGHPRGLKLVLVWCFNLLIDKLIFTQTLKEMWILATMVHYHAEWWMDVVKGKKCDLKLYRAWPSMCKWSWWKWPWWQRRSDADDCGIQMMIMFKMMMLIRVTLVKRLSECHAKDDHSTIYSRYSGSKW